MEMSVENSGVPAMSDQSKEARAASWKVANLLACLLLVLAGATYIGKTWSPSSYGHVLVNILGYADGGPDWSRSRPIRSDEYAVLTPFIQATINNGFERINRASVYQEDLRSYIGLPLRDWGLIFKPTLWLYGVVNPAYAYSAHWFAITALFIFGYAWLFRWLGATAGLGYALSAGLYFTGFVQFWWTMIGPVFALFPWTILPFATRLPLTVKALLFYWVAVAWLLTIFYPPVQVSLAFVGASLLVAREPAVLKVRSIVLLGLAAMLASGTAALYLWDYLHATSATLYPGTRIVSGGSVPWRFWLSWALPAVNFDRAYEVIFGFNICETGTVGLYYFLLLACFLDYARLPKAFVDPKVRRMVLVIGIGMAMMLAWMALPLPSWVGAPLLWNHVQPGRMQYAGGLMLLCFLLVVSQGMGFKLSLPRLAAFCALILAGWWAWKYDPSKNYFEDFFIVIFAVVAFTVVRIRPGIAHTTFAVSSLLAGILLFGRFNPLQSAWPIFNREPNQMTKALDQFAAANGGILAIIGLPGAIGNGLGYRSISHVTMVPNLPFWRKQFPDMPNEKFETIFNRYSHIVPQLESSPRTPQDDAVIVPVSRFQKTAPVRYIAPPAQDIPLAGYVDGVSIKAGSLVLIGWGAWTGPIESQELEISIAASTAGLPMRATVVRPDLPQATGNKVSALNGFIAKIPLGSETDIPPLCVVAYDTSSGVRTLLHNPPNAPTCQLGQKIQTASPDKQ